MMLFWSCGEPSRDRAIHARSKGHRIHEVPVADRQVFDLRGFDSVRALTALGLYERRFGGYGNRFGGSAYLKSNGRDAHAISAGNHDSSYQRHFKRRGGDLDGVCVGRDIRRTRSPRCRWPVMVALLFPCTSLMRATCAPGTTLPDASTTRPVTLPVVTCAGAESASRNKATTRPTEKMLRLTRIILSPLSAFDAKTPDLPAFE